VRAAVPAARLLPQRANLGFARACNLGVRAARGRYVGFVNSDCEAHGDGVARLVGHLEARPATSVAVPRLVNAAGEVQRNAGRLPTLSGIALEYLLGRIPDDYGLARLVAPTRIEAFSGAAFVLRRADFWAAGGLHEDYFMYVEDVELGRRLAALGKVVEYVPDAVLFHAEGGSSRAAPQLAAMLERHRDDYARRTMGRVRGPIARLVMRGGRSIAPVRTRLLAGLRR
jgi:GT2 family glycosyltransferase